jgi:hypothetical protein
MKFWVWMVLFGLLSLGCGEETRVGQVLWTIPSAADDPPQTACDGVWSLVDDEPDPQIDRMEFIATPAIQGAETAKSAISGDELVSRIRDTAGHLGCRAPGYVEAKWLEDHWSTPKVPAELLSGLASSPDEYQAAIFPGTTWVCTHRDGTIQRYVPELVFHGVDPGYLRSVSLGGEYLFRVRPHLLLVVCP